MGKRKPTAQEQFERVLKEQTQLLLQLATNKTYTVGAIGLANSGKMLNQETGQFVQYVPGTYTATRPAAPGQLQPSYREETALETGGLFGYLDPAPTTYQQFPRYYENDQYTPAMSPNTDDIIQLQRQLFDAGMYGGAQFQYGVWDEVDALAYKSVLAGANRAGTTDKEWLNTRLQQIAIFGKPKVGNPKPLVVTLTGADEMKRIATETAKTLFGRNIRLAPEFIDSVTNSLNQVEREVQTKDYNLSQYGEAGGEVTSTDPVGFMQAAIEKKYPAQTRDDEFANAMNQILSTMFGGSGGSG